MLVDLSYDFLVELHFLWTRRYPLELREQIREQKVSIYKELTPDLRRADMLSGVKSVGVAGRTFEVWFASDTTQDDPERNIRQLRVLHIHELA